MKVTGASNSIARELSGLCTSEHGTNESPHGIGLCRPYSAFGNGLAGASVKDSHSFSSCWMPAAYVRAVGSTKPAAAMRARTGQGPLTVAHSIKRLLRSGEDAPERPLPAPPSSRMWTVSHTFSDSYRSPVHLLNATGG